MDSRIIEITRPLPFTPSNEQVLYVEGEYDEVMNGLIQMHYEDIVHCFHMRRLDLCYMPLHFEKRAAEQALYHNPTADVSNLPTVSITTKELVNALFGDSEPEGLKPSMMIYLVYESTPEIARFKVIELDPEELANIFKHKPWSIKEAGSKLKNWWKSHFESYNYYNPNYIEKVADELTCALYDPKDSTRYLLVNWYDENFLKRMKESDNLIYEIDLKIHQLQQRGVDSLFLKKMLCQMVDDNRKLSRLVITEDYRILLPDYNDMEIKMEPINKAVYLLFLRHEEGIRLKDMPDYKDELEELYSKIYIPKFISPTTPVLESYELEDEIPGRTRSVEERRHATVEHICDPTRNSINEKISRIREAFIAKFDEDLAENYFITGNRGEAKTIKLPRDMVILNFSI